MKYIKICVKLLDFKGNIYRTFWINPCTPLINLGATIISTFNGEFDRPFNFEQGEKIYYEDSYIEFSEQFYDSEGLLSMSKYDIDDLLKKGKPIYFNYERGVNYKFIITKLDGEKEFEQDEDFDDDLIYFIEGNGYGMFVDHFELLEAVLKGRDIETFAITHYDCTLEECDFHFPLTKKEYFKPLDFDDYMALTIAGYQNYQIYKEMDEFGFIQDDNI